MPPPAPPSLALQLQKAITHHQQGELALAKQGYEDIIAIEPNHFDALHLLGVIAHQHQDYQNAVQLITQAIIINSIQPSAYNNRGLAHKELGDYTKALKDFDRAIELQAHNADAYANKGYVLQRLNQSQAALENYQIALSINPTDYEIYNNLGVIYLSLKNYTKALEVFEKSLTLKPEYVEAHSNRGTALQELLRLNEALASYEKAIKLRPEFAEAHLGRGDCLLELLYLDEALSSYHSGLSAETLEDCQWNKAFIYLLSGEFRKGWPLFESRWKSKSLKMPPTSFTQPRWFGKESLAGKTILLFSEQGLGDTIQFIRYVQFLENLGAQVILQVQAPLVALLQQVSGVTAILPTDQAPPPFDFQCPLMSLPLAFNTELLSIPNSPAYLKADSSKTAQWEARLQPKTKRRIGLAWSGNHHHKGDHKRSIPLEKLLAYLPSDADYISLQKEIRDTDIDYLKKNTPIQHFENQLIDFSDTAALLNCIDQVISVDTSVAHLAGSMGKKTWVLLPYCPDWRWLLNRTDSPWYPSLRLYRQKKPGEWDAVLEELRNDLQPFEQSKN